MTIDLFAGDPFATTAVAWCEQTLGALWGHP